MPDPPRPPPQGKKSEKDVWAECIQAALAAPSLTPAMKRGIKVCGARRIVTLGVALLPFPRYHPTSRMILLICAGSCGRVSMHMIIVPASYVRSLWKSSVLLCYCELRGCIDMSELVYTYSFFKVHVCMLFVSRPHGCLHVYSDALSPFSLLPIRTCLRRRVTMCRSRRTSSSSTVRTA